MGNKLSPHGKTICEGSVSSGTLRSKDLLRTFATELEEIKPFGERDLINEARELADRLDSGEETDAECEAASEVVNKLQDVLCEAAPDGMTFGTTEGDGACFGFWRVEDDNEGED